MISDKYVISPHVFDSVQHSMSATHGDHGAEEIFNQDPSVPHELLILYATETGTARETADRIARECRRVRFQCRVQSMDTYPPVCKFLDQRSVILSSLAGSVDFGTPGHFCCFDHWMGC